MSLIIHHNTSKPTPFLGHFNLGLSNLLELNNIKLALSKTKLTNRIQSKLTFLRDCTISNDCKHTAIELSQSNVSN